jgi:arabinofuranan 3-O-arabinosyltransferase
MTIVDHRNPVSDPVSSADTPTPPCPDPLSRWVLAALGALFLFVAFIQAPGLIIDDTKLPVIMAPLSWMKSALHLWNPTLASGAVQSETSGYLFPMAPFFELMHLLHLPVWCAERIWLAALLTVGAWGVIRLAEALGIGKPWARVLGGIAFCVAPLVVDWATVSVDLLAIVLLPWLLHPLVVGSREGSPRRAAAKSGVALALMGGVNATVIVSTLPLAVIWLLTRAPGPRRRSLIGWWVFAVVLACFWWGVPTLLQGKYGYNYLPYTETSKVTTSTGSAFEALRGASFWQNYDDLGGPLVPGGWTLVSSSAAIVGTSMVTALGLAGLARRIPERLFLVASLSFGVVVITMGYAAGLGSPFSSLVVRALAGPLGPLRNVSKFSPDVALPLALGVTWFVSTVSIDGIGDHLFHRRGRTLSRSLVGLVAVVAVVLAAMPFWQRELYPSGGFSAIPHYWQQAANYLDDHQGNQTSLIVPGANFAEYTWGNPEDEPLAVLASTSVTVRSIIPLGSDGNTVMLSTIENALATGTPQPGLAQYLSRSGIDYVVERNDLNLHETGSIPPAQVHQVLSETPGLVEVASFGPYLPMSQVAQGQLPVYDSPSSLHLRPVEIYEVQPSVSEVQSFPADNPLVISGDSGSLLPLSGAGVSDGRAAVLADDPHKADAVSRSQATWVITDGNQRRAVSFGRVDNNLSYLLGGGDRLPGLALGTPLTYGQASKANTQTVAAPLGAGSVLASSYGSNPYQNDVSEGPASAFDGDPSTAWVGSATKGSVGQWVRIAFVHPIQVSRIGITPFNTARRPIITQIAIVTDNGTVLRSIPPGSKTAWITVAPGMTRHLKITIRKVHQTNHPTYPPLGAGITDVSIPGVSFHPAMQLPTDELTKFSSPTSEPVVLNLNDPVTNPNLDFTGPTTASEPIPRRFALPRATSVGMAGTAIPLPGASLESLLSQVAMPPNQTLQISASSWLRDLPRFRPDNLIERSSLPWIAGLGDSQPSLTLRWNGMRSVGSLSLGLTSSASRPRLIAISSHAGSRQVTVPRDGGVVSFAPLTTDSLTVRFVAVANQLGRVPTGPHIVGLPNPPPRTLPVGLSSIGIPALAQPIPTPPISVTPFRLPCGAGPTVQVDQTSVRTSVVGTIGDLVDLRPVEISACSPSTISLAAGEHMISFPSGGPFRVTGLTLQSPPSGAAPTGSADQRSARVVSWTTANRTLSVGAGPATYIQVADNFNPGWVATLHGRTLTPVRLDGWEQGWIVPAGSGGTMSMVFTPDHTYRAALLLGGLFLLLLAILALWGPGRSQMQPIGRRRRLPKALLAIGAAFAALCAGGPLVLLLVPLVAVAYRWGDRAVALIAGVAFMVAGVIVAWHPYTSAGAHRGAFGSPAQFFSVLAFCAVLSAVVMEGRRRPSGRQPAPTPEGDTRGVN